MAVTLCSPATLAPNMPSKQVPRIRLVAGADSSLSEERDPGDRGMHNLDSDPLQGAGRSIG